MIHFKASITLVLLSILSQTTPVSAGNPVSGMKGEYGGLTGYGITHKYFGATRTQVQTWDAILRFGRFLSDDVGKGSWYQGRHELLMELPYHMAVDHGGRSMVGGYLSGSWKFTSLENAAPYVFAGGGPLYVDLGLPTMGTKLCYSYQAGTGLQYFIDRKTALNVEYRYHHISNAGTAEPNEPLNSSKILFGMSFFY
ncbi:MAG: acyloxyacyl hydrolase [Geobacteraceae bacterium]|nr:acyloxyacyl hydrolase [Geobacteraceae bacterium]NTW80316.1 acyloxyacyl hydrolase [Geobacteraceae bacterium]